MDTLTKNFIPLETGGGGLFQTGKNGVTRISMSLDKKVEFIEFGDRVLCYVRSSLGQPAIYPLKKTSFICPAKAVLMDLDGTSVHSEHFWMWIIERTVAELLNNPRFQFESSDEPFISGHSVSEHLMYCINKYCPDKHLSEARKIYDALTSYEMKEILNGRGKQDAFVPAPGIKEFLRELKGKHIKIALVTSGLYEKAIPEIVSAFRSLNMGDPFEFYDSIITAGTALRYGQAGTLGELSPKPHPWLYAESARIGLGLTDCDERIIGIEDSSAGILSIRLAGFSAIGIEGGNIEKGGMAPLCDKMFPNLLSSLSYIL